MTPGNARKSLEFLKSVAVRFIAHPLIKGTTIVFVGSMLVSLLNFLFNLFMSRNLSVADYGLLASLISLMTLATLPASSISPTVGHFASSYFASNDLGKVKGLFFGIGKFSFVLGGLVMIIFIVFASRISSFFNIESSHLIILTGTVVFIGLINAVNGGLLQAKLAFMYMMSINITGVILKLTFGVVLVLSGFSITGAMLALLISSIIPYCLSFVPLRFLFHKKMKETRINSKEWIVYGLPAAIALFGLTSFISSDIMLVKHFLPAKDAGIYAGLSLIGRVIFFVSAPISTVMFPLVARRYAKKERYYGTLLLALFLVGTCSLMLMGFYLLFPDFVVKFFLKNDDYLASIPFLGLYSVFITLYALLTLFVNFFLSIKKTNVYIPIAFGALLQVVLIIFFHNSFTEIIMVSILAVILPLLLFIGYFTRIYLNRLKYSII